MAADRATEARQRAERLNGERRYMGYEGDIAWFWEEVRDHGWANAQDLAQKLTDSASEVAADAIWALDEVNRLGEALRIVIDKARRTSLTHSRSGHYTTPEWQRMRSTIREHAPYIDPDQQADAAYLMVVSAPTAAPRRSPS